MSHPMKMKALLQERFSVLPFSTRLRSPRTFRTTIRKYLKTLDRKGDFKAGVLKVNVPRNDLKMTIQGVSTPTPFGFGGGSQ